jgi:hypothetical protein
MGRRPSHPQARLCGLLPVPTVRRKITWQVGPWRLPADGFPTASPDYPRLGPFSGRTFAAPRATSSPELGIGISCNGGRAMAQASRAKWPATIFLTTGLQDAVGAVLVRALRSSTIRVTDKNCGWRTAAPNTPRRPGLAKALRGLDNGWYRHILADSTLSGRRGQRYTNICSASLGADWSISAWGS